MSRERRRILSIFSFKRIIWPILIGLGVASWMFVDSFDSKTLENIRWTPYSFLWLFVALLMMAVRDLGYMYRIRLLTDKQLSWRRSFDVIMLWEFASSVTPSIVGGSAVAMFIVAREGIKTGRATAIVLITAFLDELFYVTMVPIVFLLAGTSVLFDANRSFHLFNTEFGALGIFLIGYAFILVLITIISYGIFFRPRGLKWILLWIFKMPFLRKWRQKAGETGDEIITTSKELKGKPFSFWLKAYLATFFSWTARFWVVNFLIMTVTPVGQHFLIYAKQLIMWVIMLISPTPGGSGIAELIFSDFLGEFIPAGASAALALLWRLMSYYPYLFIGALILPVWLRRVYSRKHINMVRRMNKS